MQWRAVDPSMMMAGQEQLNPCPILERAATVDSTELVNSPKNLRPFRWNSFFKYELPILLRAANTRVPDKNSPSPKGGVLSCLPANIHPTAQQEATNILV